MMALVKHVRDMDLASTDVPALFIYSEDDKVVQPALTAAAFEAWGGPKERIVVTVTDEDDPSAHVIAGDILSPNQNGPTIEAITNWASGL